MGKLVYLNMIDVMGNGGSICRFYIWTMSLSQRILRNKLCFISIYLQSVIKHDLAYGSRQIAKFPNCTPDLFSSTSAVSRGLSFFERKRKWLSCDTFLPYH